MNKTKMKKGKMLLFGSLALFLLAACGNGETDEQEGSSAEESESSASFAQEEDELKIVTTFYPMYDFTQNVAQDYADVSLLISAGTDTHEYEPSAQDMAQIQEADVFVYSSEEMETWVPSVLDAIDTENLVVINASEGIELMESSEDDHDHEEEEEEEGHAHSHEVDPHVWLDPVLAQQQVTTIKDGLTEADPENADSYESNAAAYQDALQELHKEYETALSGAENRTFVTQHAAFAYLAERYGLEQVSIAGLSTEEEPSPAVLAELKTYVQEHQIEYIYYGSATSSAIAETLATEAGVELSVLNPIEGITAQEQEDGIDYIETMRSNLEALQLSIK